MAVDLEGRPRAFGSAAVMESARRSSGLSLCRPYTSSEVLDVRLSRAYLRWLVATAGEGHTKGVPLMLVVSVSARPTSVPSWRALADSLGLKSLLVDRPLAAVAELEVEASSGRAMMLVMAETKSTEIAVVAGGVVVMARTCPPLTEGMAAVAAVVRSALVSIDPDHELDVIDGGVHLVGLAANWRVAEDLTKRLPCDVVMAANPGQVVLEGARKAMDTVRPFLPMLSGRTWRRSIKGALAGFVR